MTRFTALPGFLLSPPPTCGIGAASALICRAPVHTRAHSPVAAARVTGARSFHSLFFDHEGAIDVLLLRIRFPSSTCCHLSINIPTTRTGNGGLNVTRESLISVLHSTTSTDVLGPAVILSWRSIHPHIWAWQSLFWWARGQSSVGLEQTWFHVSSCL